MKQHLLDIGKDSIWYLIATAASSLLAFIAVPIFTRVLVPRQYGIYALIGGTISLLSVLGTIWVTGSIVRFYAGYEKEDRLQEFYSSVYHYVPHVFVLCIVLLMPLAILFFPTGPYKWPVVLAIAIMPFVLLFRISQGMARARRLSKYYAIQSIGNDAGRYLLGAALVGFAGLGVSGIFVGWLTALVAMCFMQIIVLSCVKYFSWKKNSVELQKKLVSFGFPLIAANLLGTVLAVSDRYIIQIFKGSAQVGLYSVVYSLSLSIVVGFVGFIELGVTPVVVPAYEKEGEAQAIAIVRTVTRYFLLVLIPGIVGLWLLRYRVMSVITSAKYIPAAAVLLPLITGIAMSEFAWIPSVSFHLKKRTSLLLWPVGTAAVFNVVLNLILVPFFGYPGSAWATLASYAVYLTLATIIGNRLMKWDFPWDMLLKVLGAAAVMGASLYFLNRLHARGVVMLALLIVIGGAIYIVALLAFGGLSRDEIRSIFDLIKRLPGIRRITRSKSGEE